jgi:predicted transcriptional regulator
LVSNDAKHNRTFFEIISQILGACHRNTKKTVLMNGSNMSSKQLTVYLDLVLGARLLVIENDGSHPRFRISSKGKYFLKAYEDLKTLME